MQKQRHYRLLGEDRKKRFPEKNDPKKECSCTHYYFEILSPWSDIVVHVHQVNYAFRSTQDRILKHNVLKKNHIFVKRSYSMS